MKTNQIVVFILLILTGCNVQEKRSLKYYFDQSSGMWGKRSLSYYFDRPAGIWEETLPLGNGRLGMMPDGEINSETVLLNEISLWSGSKQDSDNPDAGRALTEIRRLLFEGRNDEAQELMYSTFVCKGLGSAQGQGANAPYGSYQLLGNIVLDYVYPNQSDSVFGYHRALNLEEAVASVSFRLGNIGYQREAFTSFSDDLGVIHLVADVEKVVNFSLRMNRPEHYKVSVDGNDLVMRGQLSDGVDSLEARGMRYESRIRVVLPKGGALTQTSDSTLSVQNASEAIILVSMATDYFDKSGYENQITSLLSKAEGKDFATLKREHVSAYQALFNRVDLNLGSSDRENLPIDERLRAFHSDQDDPGLAALYFQFGRYLLISSTRPGLLPPNLQGLWSNTVQAPWNGDYHLNINLQMNHWPAEVTNLPELHLPLVEWTKQQVVSGEQTARVFYNARGWVTHVLGNVWEFTAPGEHPSWGATNTSAAWLCEHLYTHYQYTKDKEYLKEVYPVMRGASLFFVDMLTEDPRNKYLVTAPTTSPENGYKMNGKVVSVCAGSTMDNQIIRELFTNTIEAAGILGVDTAFAEELAAKKLRLMPTSIARDGRIMEWLQEYEEAEPHHRHVSHLYGLYPANEISIEHTPELAEAARKSLEARGDQSTGWSMAWKMNFWARLHDGDHAFKLLCDLLRPCVDKDTKKVNGGGTYPNLFCAHPPFQIDGNLGGCAGIAEMLIQSQTGLIELLPALPSAWKSGEYKGLKVRGGGEVSAKWVDSALTDVTLKAVVPGTFRIKLPANSANLSIKKNQKAASLPVSDGVLALDLEEGDEVLLQF